MGITLWGSGTVLLSLLILSDLVVDPSIAYSQSAGMAGSGRTGSGENHGTATKPKNSKPGPGRPGTQPSDMPGQAGDHASARKHWKSVSEAARWTSPLLKIR